MSIAAIFLAIMALSAFVAIIEMFIFFFYNKDEDHQPNQRWKDPYDYD